MIILIKEYKEYFGINYQTASIMYYEDCQNRNASRITIYSFIFMYRPDLIDKVLKTPMKSQKLKNIVLNNQNFVS